MSRLIILLGLSGMTSGCFLTNEYNCFMSAFPEEAGSYTTRQIPDHYVALGDTLFLNINEYWKYDYRCDKYADYPYINSFIADSREVELHRQDDNIFIVGQKTGVFKATVIGDVVLTRNSKDRVHFIPMSFNIEVGTRPGSPLRQRATFPATGRIDSIVVKEVNREKKALRILAAFSPEYVKSGFTDLQSWWAFYPVRNIDSLYQMDLPLQTTHAGFDNEFFFRPDSMYSFYYGYVEVQPGQRKFGKTFLLDTSVFFE